MKRMRLRLQRGATVTAVALAAIFVGVTAKAQSAANPLAALAGGWTGGGTLTLLGGTKENVRCRAEYSVTGEMRLRQDLRCASDSYRFDVIGDVVYSNGTISGNWHEVSRNVAGKLSGRASATLIEARIEGMTFAALLSVNTRGNRQTVSIRSPGSQVEDVQITLRRR